MPKKTKYPVVRKEWPRIIDYRTNGSRCYMLDARPHGRREYFQKVGEAKARADQLAAERERRGVESISFSTENRVMAVECLAKLTPFGKTLRDATDHFVAHLTNEAAKQQSLFVRECVEQFIASRQADMERGELSKLSFYETRDRAKRFKAACGDLHIAEIGADHIKAYLDSCNVGPRTRINLRLRLSKFFNFCRERGWIDRNPCAEIKLKAKRADTRILSVEETNKLLSVAQESKYQEVAVPYAALCLFAGLRPGEAEQLRWERINFDTRSIEVLGETSKGRETRFVTMEETLIRWLKPFAKKQGHVVRSNFRKKWESVKRDAGYDPTDKAKRWVQDIMRHSYASYWLALHQNRAQLAELMGNSVDVIRKHYRRPILKADAERFWQTMPD